MRSEWMIRVTCAPTFDDWLNWSELANYGHAISPERAFLVKVDYFRIARYPTESPANRGGLATHTNHLRKPCHS